MLKILYDCSFIFFVTICIIWHLIKIMCLYHKPEFLKKLQILPKDTPTKNDLLTYYLIIIVGALFILFKYLKQIEIL